MPRVNLRVMQLHVSLGSGEWRESKLRVESVSIPSYQAPASQSLQSRVLHDALHQPLAQTPPAVPSQYEYVTDVGVGGVIRDHAGKPDLLAGRENPKAQRILYRPGDNLPRNPLGPIGIRQESVDKIQIQALPVSADAEIKSLLSDSSSLFTSVRAQRGFTIGHLHQLILAEPPAVGIRK